MKINNNDKNIFKKGMKIRVSGYTVHGDEGKTLTHFRRTNIMKNSKLPYTVKYPQAIFIL